MKKTLIALVALAGLANADMVTLGDDLTLVSAVSPETQASGNEAISFDTTKTASPTAGLTDYVLTFSFTKVTNTNTDGFIRVNGYDHMSVRGTLDKKIFISSAANSGEPKTDGTLVADTTSTFALTVSGTNNVAYLSNLSTGDVVTLSNLGDTFTQASDYTFKSGNARVYTNNGQEQLAFGQIANLAGLTATEVAHVAKYGNITPEPATATLSLLALAGLAARRKRH